MSLARARRGRYQANYWPGFVDMLSTLLLVVTFLMSLFMLSNFVVTQATSGKDTMLSRLNRQLAELTELLALERSKKESVEDNLAALQATLGEKEKENDRLTGLLGTAGGATQSAEERAKALGSSLDRAEEDHQRRARQGRDAEPAARGAAAPDRLAARGAGSLRGQGQGQPGQDRRSRPAAQRGARQEGAGAGPLPLRLLRQAAGSARQPRRLPDRRRPLRVSLRRAVRFRLRHLEAGGRLAARQARRGAARPRDANPAGHRLGDARRRPYRHQADRHAPISLELGAVERAGDFGGALSDVAGRAGEPAGCRRLRRVPADRPGDSDEALPRTAASS